MDELKIKWDAINDQIDQLNHERIALLSEMVKQGWKVEDLLQPIELTQGGPVQLGAQKHY